jgi:hypothetical protein
MSIIILNSTTNIVTRAPVVFIQTVHSLSVLVQQAIDLIWDLLHFLFLRWHCGICSLGFFARKIYWFLHIRRLLVVYKFIVQVVICHLGYFILYLTFVRQFCWLFLHSFVDYGVIFESAPVVCWERVYFEFYWLLTSLWCGDLLWWCLWFLHVFWSWLGIAGVVGQHTTSECCSGAVWRLEVAAFITEFVCKMMLLVHLVISACQCLLWFAFVFEFCLKQMVLVFCDFYLHCLLEVSILKVVHFPF